MLKSYAKAGADVVTFATEQKDAASDVLETIDHQVSEIHDGDSYEYSEVKDQTVNHVYDIQITTPNTTKWAHFTFEFDVEAETDWYFYENPNIILAGTAVTPLNHDRNSTSSAGLIVKVITNVTIGNANADTAVVAAITLRHGIAGAGKKIGGFGGTKHGWILKQNEDYCIRFIASAGGFVSFHLDWHEHTNIA